MVTSEFAVAGLMPQLSEGLGVGIEQIGYLVTIFAVAMAVGGPILTAVLLRVPPKSALMVIFSVFFTGNLLAAFATSYEVMVIARIVTGVASQAFFGIAISLCAQLVDERVRGRAIGVAMNGLMLGTLLGLPAATMIGGRFGWQTAFWAIAILTAIAAGLTIRYVHNPPKAATNPGGDDNSSQRRLVDELAVFGRPQLLLALASSTLIIGATFSAFSFFTPILTEVTEFSVDVVPILLLAYGGATVVGNIIVGRLADRHTISTMLVGTTFNALFLIGFALFTDAKTSTLVFMLGIGLVGVTMNPAMATRVQRAGNSSAFVNTVHSSFITLGIILGSAIGAALLPHYGLTGPLVLGIGMALLAIAAIAPALGSPYLRRGENAPLEGLENQTRRL